MCSSDDTAVFFLTATFSVLIFLRRWPSKNALLFLLLPNTELLRKVVFIYLVIKECLAFKVSSTLYFSATQS